MILVIDASVALKWFFRSADDEPDGDLALAILKGISEDRIQLLQPPHFFAEVATVLAREKKPEAAGDDLLDLLSIESRFADDLEIYATAIELAARYRHHLLDTLYHAVALHTRGASLITADKVYYRKAHTAGHIMRLQDFRG